MNEQGNHATTDESVPSTDETYSMVPGRQLVVVSNRQPYRHTDDGDGIDIDRPTGGLTAGLDPVMQDVGGTWIAWGDGDADEQVVDDSDCVSVPPEDPSYTLRRLWLSDEQVDGYYYGFSNRVLWPICHSALSTVDAEPLFWEQYYETNQQFADAIGEEADDSPFVWIQDYHFALAPWMVRRQLQNAIIMQFWHIPWPSWDTFRASPHQETLLGGLLGNDVLTFHVKRYRDNFLECVERALPEATVNYRAGEVTYRGRTTSVQDIPMGVPFDQIRQDAQTQTQADFDSLKQQLGIASDTKIALGVDRLDYSKGIVERLRALERLWETHPEWRESLTYVQNASKSRSQIQAYQTLQNDVDEAIDRINRRFGTDDWQPVVNVTEYLTHETLHGLYRYADIGLVSPIRDGLNLVAMEYVAAQVDGDGVLVLSTQTGAHDLFGDHAVSVTPFDIDEFAERLDDALTMPLDERQSRMKRLRRTVAVNDLESWLRQNAESARAVAQVRDGVIRHGSH